MPVGYPISGASCSGRTEGACAKEKGGGGNRLAVPVTETVADGEIPAQLHHNLILLEVSLLEAFTRIMDKFAHAGTDGGDQRLVGSVCLKRVLINPPFS